MPAKKQKPTQIEGEAITITPAEIKRVKKMYQELRLNLQKVEEQIDELMGHIPHCP